MNSRLIVAAGFCLLLGACSYSSPTRAPSSRAVVVSPQVSASIALNSTQARLVEAFIADSRPRGRGRNGGLPPGIERNLARGKALPPGIAKQYLPSDLLAQLPVLPGGLQYLIVAGKLMLVESATQIIRDVLLDTLV